MIHCVGEKLEERDANQTLAVEKAGAELVDPDVKRPLLRAEVSSSLTGLTRAALILG